MEETSISLILILIIIIFYFFILFFVKWLGFLNCISKAKYKGNYGSRKEPLKG
jgi:hypothetical protein